MPPSEQPPSALYPDPHVSTGERLGVLDGWRAISILAVMAGHWLPLDIVLPGTNEAVPVAGMAIFFTLSGFLITRFLADRPQVVPFLIRRVLRIVPLAWLAMLILFIVDYNNAGSIGRAVANLLFFSNLPPQRFLIGGEHLWSLCVEMQFYLGVALLVTIGGRRSLILLPLLALSVTTARIIAGETVSIVTWHRLDEILAGAMIALIYLGWLGPRVRQWLASYPFWLAVILAAATCYFVWTPLAYARPYAVAGLVGVTLFHCPEWVRRSLVSRPAAYVANISYALYVFHGMLGATWLGSGDVMEKYMKRPLLVAATFVLAHCSTYWFEQRFIRLAKSLTSRRQAATATPARISSEAVS